MKKVIVFLLSILFCTNLCACSVDEEGKVETIAKEYLQMLADGELSEAVDKYGTEETKENNPIESIKENLADSLYMHDMNDEVNAVFENFTKEFFSEFYGEYSIENIEIKENVAIVTYKINALDLNDLPNVSEDEIIQIENNLNTESDKLIEKEFFSEYFEILLNKIKNCEFIEQELELTFVKVGNEWKLDLMS